jgi:hypothetical protein
MQVRCLQRCRGSRLLPCCRLCHSADKGTGCTLNFRPTLAFPTPTADLVRFVSLLAKTSVTHSCFTATSCCFSQQLLHHCDQTQSHPRYLPDSPRATSLNSSSGTLPPKELRKSHQVHLTFRIQVRLARKKCFQ